VNDEQGRGIPRAILFDFDGTLADTFPRVRRLLPRLARELRFRDPGPRGIEKLRELPMRQILSRLGVAWWKIPLLLWRTRALLRADVEKILLFPGIAELLGALDQAGVEWGIQTTNSLEVVRETLRHGGAPEPGWIESGLGLSGKARSLRRMAHHLGVPRDQLLLIADETRDAGAARAAGVPMIGVAWGYNTRASLERAGVEHLVGDVAELRRTLLGAIAEEDASSE